MRFKGILLLGLVLIVATAFAGFYAPCGDISLGLSWATFGWNSLKDYTDLDVFQKDKLIDFKDPSYLQVRWFPYINLNKTTTESTEGTLINLSEWGQKDWARAYIWLRNKLSDKMYFEVFGSYWPTTYWEHDKDDSDGNGKYTEDTYNYSGSSHSSKQYNAGLVYAQDFGAFVGRVEVGYFHDEQDYALKETIQEDGTKTYNLNGGYYGFVPSSSGTSFDGVYNKNSYTVLASLYVVPFGVWVKDAKYSYTSTDYIYYVTPKATMEPRNLFKYFKLDDAQDKENKTEIGGEVGVDLAYGGFKIAPSVYVNKYDYKRVWFNRKDRDDQSSSNNDKGKLTVKPQVAVYIPFMEAKVVAYYYLESSRWLRYSYDYNKKLNTFTCPSTNKEYAYDGDEYSKNELSLSASKKFDIFGVNTIITGSAEYSMESQKGVAYTEKMKKIDDKVIEYNRYWAYDRNTLSTVFNLVLYKSFFDDKVMFGGIMEGSYSYKTEKDYSYDTTEKKVKYNSSSNSDWKFNPFSQVFLSVKMFDNLYIGVSGSANGSSWENYPDKWEENNKYVAGGNITKNSNFKTSLIVTVRYLF